MYVCTNKKQNEMTILEALKQVNRTISKQEVIQWFNDNDIEYYDLNDLEMYIKYIEQK